MDPAIISGLVCVTITIIVVLVVVLNKRWFAVVKSWFGKSLQAQANCSTTSDQKTLLNVIDGSGKCPQVTVGSVGSKIPGSIGSIGSVGSNIPGSIDLFSIVKSNIYLQYIGSNYIGPVTFETQSAYSITKIGADTYIYSYTLSPTGILKMDDPDLGTNNTFTINRDGTITSTHANSLRLSKTNVVTNTCYTVSGIGKATFGTNSFTIGSGEVIPYLWSDVDSITFMNGDTQFTYDIGSDANIVSTVSSYPYTFLKC